MGRIYTAVLDSLSVSAAVDLFHIVTPADSVAVIHELKITQSGSTASEQVPIEIWRTADVAAPAGGTALTPRPLDEGSAAAGIVVYSNLTAGDITAETTILMKETQNVLNGFHILPTPEMRIVISPSSAIAIKFTTAETLTIDGYVTFEEIGG